MMAGTWLFAALFGALEGFYMAGQGPEGQTVPALLGVPDWVILVAMIGMAVAGWQLGSGLERKRGGPVTAESILEGR
jgi:hypothetical protein